MSIKPPNPKAIDSLNKVIAFTSTLSDEEWKEFCVAGALDLTMLARESNVTRSVMYQNRHVVQAVKELSISLLEKGIIEVAPYASKQDKDNTKAPARERVNAEISKLKEENRLLQIKVSDLKAEINDKRNKNNQLKMRLQLNAQSGRLPR